MNAGRFFLRSSAIGLIALPMAVAACGGSRYERAPAQAPAGARVSSPAAERLTPASRTELGGDERRMSPASSDRGAGSTPTARFEMDLERDCPMTLEGVKVTALPKEEGMALAFETRSGSIDELRRRVRWLAAEYDAHSDALFGMSGVGSPDALGRPGISVGVQDVATGAKIMFHGQRQGDIDAMRIELREQADGMMRLRTCEFLREDIGPSAAR